MNNILQFTIDIVSTPALLVALIAVLGNILQGKGISEIIKGGIKTFVGFLIVTAGTGVIENSIIPFGELFQNAFNLQGVVPNNEAVIAVALNQYGTNTALIMLAGMIFNILIARITMFKYIFLTGHHTLYLACMIAVIMTVSGFNSISLILLGGLMLGIVMTLSPAIVQKYMIKLTGNDAVALGHFSAVGYWLSGFVGDLIGDNSQSTEDIKFPQGISFLRDSTVSIALSMILFYVLVMPFADYTFVIENLSNGLNPYIWGVQQGGTFAAGVAIILSGVRMILNEIVPAFKGISEKLVPNAKPALDCPIVFTYAPNAVLIGFVSSFIGGLISMLVMIFSGTVVILPGVVPHFFCGATAGVMGNASGGVKGSVLGSFCQGILISFLPILLMPYLGDIGFAGSTFSDADFLLSGIFLGGLSNIGGTIAVTIGIIGVLALMIGGTIVYKNKAAKN